LNILNGLMYGKGWDDLLFYTNLFLDEHDCVQM